MKGRADSITTQKYCQMVLIKACLALPFERKAQAQSDAFS